MAKKPGFRTLGDVVEWWLERLEADNNRSAKYRGSMASLMRVQVLPRVGKVLISKIDRVVLDDKLVWPMHQAGLAPRTIQKAMQGLRQAFAMAEEMGRLVVNPMASITFRNFYKGKLKPKPAALSRIDLRALVLHLVAVFNDDPVRGMLPLLMLAHGTRIGETLSARWSRVSLDERIWFISAADQKSSREHLLPLTPQVVGLFNRYRQALPDQRLRSIWVFAVRGGGRLADTSAHRLIREISGRAWSSHDLRKLMRDSLADIGIDYMVAERLINHSLGVTAETYLTKDDMARRRDALERWHSRLDECGFADAHGVKVAVPALLQNNAAPELAGIAAVSSASMGGG